MNRPLTDTEAATIRAAAEREAVRCMIHATDHDARGPEWSTSALWWRGMAATWRREAERRIDLGLSACHGWAGVNLERAA